MLCVHLATKTTIENKRMKNLHEFRKEYTLARLDEDALKANPMDLFSVWLKDAIDSGHPDPNAMTVATVNNEGQPNQRIVLLKDVNPKGFVFYTNLGSNKATDLAHNQHVSLHFPWYFMERQVSVQGTASLLPRERVEEYFHSRPKNSQLGAWASEQSKPIASREQLVKRFTDLQDEYAEQDVPLPDFWGGYLVEPNKIEFWQGGEYRLHDRFVFTLQDDTKWTHQRLMP